MVRLLIIPQRKFLALISPAIRFTCKECNPFGCLWLMNEAREIRRQRRQRKLVDEPVPFVIPGLGRHGYPIEGRKEH